MKYSNTEENRKYNSFKVDRLRVSYQLPHLITKFYAGLHWNKFYLTMLNLYKSLQKNNSLVCNTCKKKFID